MGHPNNVERSSEHSSSEIWCPPACLYLEPERLWTGEIFMISSSLQLA